MPGYEVALWNGIVMPANTPPDIVNRLNAAIVKAVWVAYEMHKPGRHAKRKQAAFTPSRLAQIEAIGVRLGAVPGSESSSGD